MVVFFISICFFCSTSACSFTTETPFQLHSLPLGSGPPHPTAHINITMPSLPNDSAQWMGGIHVIQKTRVSIPLPPSPSKTTMAQKQCGGQTTYRLHTPMTSSPRHATSPTTSPHYLPHHANSTAIPSLHNRKLASC